MSETVCYLLFMLGGIGLEPSGDGSYHLIGDPRYHFNDPVLVLPPYGQVTARLQKELFTQSILVREGIIPRGLEHILPKVHRILKETEFEERHNLSYYDVILFNAPKSRDDWVGAPPDNMFRLIILYEACCYSTET